jgi:hypothetical protein
VDAAQLGGVPQAVSERRERLGWPRPVSGNVDPLDLVLATQVVGQRPDHQQIHPRGRRRRRGGRRGRWRRRDAWRRRRSCRCRGRRHRAGGRARPPASRRTCRRSRRSVGACSPTRAAIRSASGQVALLNPLESRAPTTATSTGSSAIAPSTSSGSGTGWRGAQEPLLAHRPALFAKPRPRHHGGDFMASAASNGWRMLPLSERGVARRGAEGS